MSGPVPIFLGYAACSYALRFVVLSVGAPAARRRRYAGFALLESAAFLALVWVVWGRVPAWVAALAGLALAANLLTARFCGRCGRKRGARGGRGGTRCAACGGKLLAAWA